ncbi:MAG: glucokinase [Betaproteobacteria bacterium]|nr:glucokinase [Betaproteobacteria bacterium]
MILAADIGGTKTLVCLWPEDPRQPPLLERRYANADFPGFEQLLERFADEARAAGPTVHGARACFALAGPVCGARARLTNLPWEIDAPRLQSRFRLARVILANDLAASAAGISDVPAERRDILQAGQPRDDAPQVVVGVGTGLGVAIVLPGRDGPALLPGEAGHMGFAPRDEAQMQLWHTVHAQYGRVSAEHVISGPGLVRIFRHLHALAPQPTDEALLRAADPAHAVGSAALAASHAGALAAVRLLGACLGSFSGDLALATLARGGVYLCGGIVTKLAPVLRQAGILGAFLDKGVHRPLMDLMPLHLVREERLALLGAARLATQGGYHRY